MRAALYARVSSEEQVEGYSIDAQRRAFKALCESRQWTPYREYIEEGKSARTDNINKRPVFKQAIADGLSRNYDVLVVHKVDRFSRKLRITLEYFDKLAKAEVGFISIAEQIDFSTPWGKFTLSMFGGLAELYSDNLSFETKKGWSERRAQGLYCGLLPFGAMKDENGVPVPDPETFPGLEYAFELAARGKTDREIAQALNAKGYRTAGNQGNGPFSRDTMRGILQNRFYIGQLTNGNGGWAKAKHEPFISQDLWDAAQKTRQMNRKAPKSVPRKRGISSLTGIARCIYCGGRMNIWQRCNNRRRLVCYNRSEGQECPQRSAYLDVYEAQIEEYLRSFHIPADYRKKILEAQQRLYSAYDSDDVGREQATLETALERLKELYKWGDKTREHYLAEKTEIERRLRALAPLTESRLKKLDKLAHFLKHIAGAWKVANQEQRNTLARSLFQEVWIGDREVVAVRPQPELESFFDLHYQESGLALPHGTEERLSRFFWNKRPRGDLNP